MQRGQAVLVARVDGRPARQQHDRRPLPVGQRRPVQGRDAVGVGGVVFREGSSIGPAAYATGLILGGACRIGAHPTTAANYPDMIINELILYEAAHSPADRAAIEAELGA